eukprot:1649983-Prymnesium_polylepis.1
MAAPRGRGRHVRLQLGSRVCGGARSPRASARGGAPCAARTLLLEQLSPPSLVARRAARPRRFCRARRRARSLAA